MTIHDHFNPDLLAHIPINANTVLEVGCSTGALGAEYKRRNPACRFFGIDQHADAANLAASRIDHVALCDVQQVPRPFGSETFDCIVYGDVLEHLLDPWAVLRSHAAALNPGGTIVLCIPNVEHWSFTERLLRGNFDYADSGLFDRTHLRWFSDATIRRALRDVGLVVCDMIPRVFDRDGAGAFAHAMRPALRALGIDPQHYLQRATPLQLVYVARREAASVFSIASTMLPPIGGVSHVRVIEPIAALATLPGIAARVVNAIDNIDVPDTPRIMILHRPALIGEAGLEPVRKLLAKGYVLICEFDDNPDFIPATMHPDMWNFRAVHAVQTSTEPLAERFRQDNPEVMVFPNAINRLPDPANFSNPARLNMLFAGLNRQGDWPPYMEALNAVANFAGDRLTIHIVADREAYDRLETPHKTFTPMCGYETYQAMLGACEISFMPLSDNVFNRGKSDLKFIEAAAHRVVPLASHVVYADSVVDGGTGVLFSTADQLRQRLANLVANPGAALRIATDARAEVAANRMLAYQVARRIAWYRSLWDRRESLHAALLARLPQLAEAVVSTDPLYNVG